MKNRKEVREDVFRALLSNHYFSIKEIQGRIKTKHSIGAIAFALDRLLKSGIVAPRHWWFGEKDWKVRIYYRLK